MQTSIMKAELVYSMVKKYNENKKIIFKIDDSFSGTPEYCITKYFEFPLFDKTKYELAKIATENEWVDIMNKTQFCSKINNDYTPCGKCGKCFVMLNERVGFEFHNIPLHRRLKGEFKSLVVIPLKQKLKKFLLKLGLLELNK